MENIEIKSYEKINMEEIKALYTSVGWTNYTDHPEMLKNAYEHSLKIYGAYVEGKLAGIIRVVGDGYSILYIQDILIFPEYQRKGIGTKLLKKILDEYDEVYQKILLTDNKPDTVAFYKSLGFIADYEMECVAFGKYHV